jgi:hypothetical protein
MTRIEEEYSMEPEKAVTHQAPEKNQFGTPEFQALLEHGRYTIRDIDTLKGVLGDAFALYDIEAGKARLSELLSVIEPLAIAKIETGDLSHVDEFFHERLKAPKGLVQ